jgi:hypothetical protein
MRLSVVLEARYTGYKARVLFLRNQSRVKPTYSISNTGFDHSLTLYLSFIAKSSIAQDLLIVNFINVATVPSGSG